MRNGFAPIYDSRSAWEMQNSVGFGWSIFVTFLYRVLWRICDIEACVKLSVTSWEIIQRYIIAEPSECSFYNQLLPFQIIKSNPRAIHIKLQKTPMKQQKKKQAKKKSFKSFLTFCAQFRSRIWNSLTSCSPSIMKNFKVTHMKSDNEGEKF